MVTYGEKGSDFAGWRVVHVPAAPARQVIDPTGAGDAFRGGMLAGLLLDLPSRSPVVSRISPRCTRSSNRHAGTLPIRSTNSSSDSTSLSRLCRIDLDRRMFARYRYTVNQLCGRNKDELHVNQVDEFRHQGSVAGARRPPSHRMGRARNAGSSADQRAVREGEAVRRIATARAVPISRPRQPTSRSPSRPAAPTRSSAQATRFRPRTMLPPRWSTRAFRSLPSRVRTRRRTTATFRRHSITSRTW